MGSYTTSIWGARWCLLDAVPVDDGPRVGAQTNICKRTAAGMCIGRPETCGCAGIGQVLPPLVWMHQSIIQKSVRGSVTDPSDCQLSCIAYHSGAKCLFHVVSTNPCLQPLAPCSPRCCIGRTKAALQLLKDVAHCVSVARIDTARAWCVTCRLGVMAVMLVR